MNVRSGITRSSSHHSQPFPALITLSFSLVPPLQKVRKQVAQELQCDILEGPRRAVPQLHDPFFLARLSERRDVLVSERTVRPVNDVFEVGRRDDALGDEQGEDTVRELDEGEGRPAGLPVCRKCGNVRGDVQTVYEL